MQFNEFMENIHARCLASDIIIGLMASSIFINLLSLVFPLTLLQIYDRIIPNSAIQTLIFLIIGVFCAVVFEGVLRILRAKVSGWADSRYEHLVSCNMYDHFLQSKLSDYERQGPGVHLARMNAILSQKDFFIGQALITLLDIPFVFLYLFFIWYLAGWVVLVPICILIVFTAVTIHFGRFLKETNDARRTHDERRINFIVDVLRGIHSVKALALEALIQRRYERLVENSAIYDRQLANNSGDAAIFSGIATQLSMILVVSFGCSRVIDGVLTIGGLAACTFLSSRILQPITRAVGVWSRLQSISIAETKIDDHLALASEVHDQLATLPELQGDIRFESVSFAYPGRESALLDNINLQIRPGEMIGLQGNSLSGKSTLLWLILGAISPTSGKLFLDNHDISELNPLVTRQSIAYIPQNGIIFSGNLLENLTMFRPELSETAKEVCRELGIEEMILRLPKGYSNAVGQHAVDYLPRGFKQRICIARALLDNPSIILFDEANTNIDFKADEIVRKALAKRKGSCTQIIVSHRPSLLSLCDRCYQLKDGRLHDASNSQ